MSRTYKDVPRKFRYPDDEWDARYTTVEYTRDDDSVWRYWLEIGDKPKIKKNKCDKWFWYRATPGWWVNLYMTRPQRRAANIATRTLSGDLEEVDIPDFKRKPHVYYY